MHVYLTFITFFSVPKDMKYQNDVGYFPDGTAINKAGNAMNHPETVGPDLHKDGSALPVATFMNTVGYPAYQR